MVFAYHIVKGPTVARFPLLHGPLATFSQRIEVPQPESQKKTKGQQLLITMSIYITAAPIVDD